MAKPNSEFKYFAFISYNSKDTKWGKRLQKKLEHFNWPVSLGKEKNLNKKPLNPIFFAPTDIQPGNLSDELKGRLEDSKHLIVICSPNSAQSEWVGREIAYFHSLGKDENIHFFIVDGIPNSRNVQTECFNPIISEIGLSEILGANVNEKTFKLPWLNRERAYVQLISKLLNVEFDSIWKRQRRKLINNIVLWILGLLIVVGAIVAVWFLSKPVDLKMKLNEISPHNANLPPLNEGVVTLKIENETKSDTIKDISKELIFPNIPAKFLGKEVKINFDAFGFIPLDTTLILKTNTSLNIRRDPNIYGSIKFKLWNPELEEPVKNHNIQIEGFSTSTNEDGYLEITLPIEKQKPYYIVSGIKLVNDTLFMPTTEDTYLLIDTQ